MRVESYNSKFNACKKATYKIINNSTPHTGVRKQTDFIQFYLRKETPPQYIVGVRTAALHDEELGQVPFDKVDPG